MIKNIFWDLDQSLIATEFSAPDQNHIRFALEEGGVYYTMIRPCAKRLIEFSRQLIGPENVFILTASTKDYACEINLLAEFGFPRNQILAREDLQKSCFPTAYGGSSVVASEYADLDNVLIDNLDPRYNADKVAFLGMWRSIDTNYFKVRDYYGVNFPNDPFESDIKAFLEERHSAPSLKNE